MPIHQILRDECGREVHKFTTDSGVTGWVDTAIPEVVIDAFISRLKRKRRLRRRILARRLLALAQEQV